MTTPLDYSGGAVPQPPRSSLNLFLSSAITAIVLLAAAAGIGWRVHGGLPAPKFYPVTENRAAAKPASNFQRRRQAVPDRAIGVSPADDSQTLSAVAAGLPDYDALRRQIEDQLRDDLGATPDQWAALEPDIAQIQQLQWQLAETSPIGNLFPINPPLAPPAAFAPTTNIDTAINNLRGSLNQPDSTPDAIQYKIERVRKSRDAVQKQLTAAQADLTKLATPRQQAILIAEGILQ